jgi:hypothetical protein
MSLGASISTLHMTQRPKSVGPTRYYAAKKTYREAKVMASNGEPQLNAVKTGLGLLRFW